MTYKQNHPHPPREAHRSRTRRRPRPREVRCKLFGAGIVSTCSVGIAPRVRGVGDAFRALFVTDIYLGLKSWTILFRHFMATRCVDPPRVVGKPVVFRPLRQSYPVAKVRPETRPGTGILWEYKAQPRP